MKKVTDDVLGKLSTKQWELTRRVKEGSLDPDAVINALQCIIENQVQEFEIEKIPWTVSSKVHEVSVTEGLDFVKTIKADGHVWHYSNKPMTRFELEGNPGRRKYKARLRLATIEGNHEEGVLRTYAEIVGFDFATSWEMLAFINQSPLTRVLKSGTKFIALGDYGKASYEDLPPGDTSSPHYDHTTADAWVNGRAWSFDNTMGPDHPSGFRRKQVSGNQYILLKEKINKGR
jgi:hypothetical protein